MMINLESLIIEVRQALDRDPGADLTLIKSATLMSILDMLTMAQDEIVRRDLGG
jgi:hypothetical protein